ncbi:MAG: hypothetical protein E6J34_22095 [Chloroflexi bacterium]|nr:MAG: hypothetical protein E6J34_22095 [Chloroflexota bacterium]
MAVLRRRQFRVRVFRSLISRPRVIPSVDEEIGALTEVFAVVLVLWKHRIRGVCTVCVTCGSEEWWWYGVRLLDGWLVSAF